jgi:DNA-binding MarR family transcriptional regulator
VQYQQIIEDRKTMRQRSEKLKAILVPYRLTVNGWVILSELQENGAKSVTELATLLDTSLAHITTSLNVLESRGYVARGLDKADTRKRVITCTRRGADTLKVIGSKTK